MGNVREGIMAVRFTYRGNVICIYGEVIGEKEGKYMKTKIKYTEEPMAI